MKVANTAGGIGSQQTLAFSKQLTKLAKEMRKEKTDPVLTKMVSVLARAGHDLARSEARYENLCQMGTACGQYNYYNDDQTKKQYQTALQSLQNVGNKHQTFQKKLTSLNEYMKQNRRYVPTKLRDYVNSHAEQITSISQQYKPSFYTPVTAAATPNSQPGAGATWGLGTVGGMGSTPGSQQTHTLSNQICDAGGRNCRVQTSSSGSGDFTFSLKKDKPQKTKEAKGPGPGEAPPTSRR